MKKFLLALTLFASALVSAAPLTLQYTKPAPDTAEGWEREALPIGNGRLGAMLFGGVSKERLQFNEITLWTGDAKTMGMGVITAARWKATYELMVEAGLLPKETDWTKGFTTQFVKDLKITSR